MEDAQSQFEIEVTELVKKTHGALSRDKARQHLLFVRKDEARKEAELEKATAPDRKQK